MISDLYKKCPICSLEYESLTLHHLIPKEVCGKLKKKKLPKCYICIDCHRQIHRLFSNRELKKNYNTLDKLCNAPEVKKWMAWKQKKHGK